jgi:hypothetical protein
MKAAARIRVMDLRLIQSIRVASFLAGLLVATLAYGEVRVRPVPPPPAPVTPQPQPAAPIDIAGEVSQLREALIDEVPHLIIDTPRGKQEWIARTWLR